jgi:hypothetical protein
MRHPIAHQYRYGVENPSTATALHNLALCYKAMAAEATGMDTVMLLEQAKQAFEDALGAQQAVAEILATIDGEAAAAALQKGQEATALTMSGMVRVFRQQFNTRGCH